MKRILFWLLSFAWLISANAEDVGIILQTNYHETELDYIPGVFTIDGSAIPYVVSEYDYSVLNKDGVITVYNNEFDKSEINFGNVVYNVVLYDVRTQCNSPQSMPFSQTFFNDDEQYEYVTCDYKTITSIYDNKEMAYNFRIVSQNGETLYNLENPKGLYNDVRTFSFTKIDDNTIIAEIRYSIDEKGEWLSQKILCYYLIKTNQTGINAPIIDKKTVESKSYIVNQGDVLTLSMNDGKSHGKMMIYTISGQLEKYHLETNQSYTINTSSLSKGVYIIRCEDPSIESAKLIVR